MSIVEASPELRRDSGRAPGPPIVAAIDELDSKWCRRMARLEPVRWAQLSPGVSLQRRLEHLSLDRARANASAAPAGIWLSGPGAVGKGEIKAWLRRSLGADVLINATTRGRRPAEREGVDYYFMRLAAFERHRTAGDFVSTRHIAGRGHYGLLRSEFTRRHGGLVVIEESPVVLGRVSDTVMDALGEVLLVYLLPPDPFLRTLAERFLHRSAKDARLSNIELVAALRSTLSIRQVLDLKAAIDRLFAQRPVVFLVNDDLEATTAALVRHLRGFGMCRAQ